MIKDQASFGQEKASPATKPASRSGGRLEFLDFMRAIAALAVLVEHGGYHFIRGFARFTHDLFSFGKFGITAFFLVSGFIIPLSLERKPGLERFWILRFFRLYPLYWFSLLAALVLYRFGDAEVLTADFTSRIVINSLANFSMLQGIAGIPHAIGLYYTLTIEMLFYIVCTVLVVTKRLKDNYRISWMILLAASTVGVGAPLVLQHRVEMAGLFYVVTLAAGSVMYRFYTREVSPSAFGAFLLGVALFVVSGVWLNYVEHKKADLFEHYEFIAVALPWVAGYMLFLGLLALRGLNYSRTLLYVGRISYSIYLLHPLVLSFFRVQEGNTIGFVLFTAISLLLATVSFHFIEKPALEVGQRVSAALVRNRQPQAV